MGRPAPRLHYFRAFWADPCETLTGRRSEPTPARRRSGRGSRARDRRGGRGCGGSGGHAGALRLADEDGVASRFGLVADRLPSKEVAALGLLFQPCAAVG